MEPQNNSGVKTWQWVVTVIVIIILIVIGIMVFGGKSSTPVDNSGVTTDQNGNTTMGANSIVMADQYPGNVAYISSVQLEKGGWIVIQSDNAGQPGTIIGETWVGAGISPAKVTLTSPMVDGSTYYATLYSDNGDQQFDATTDLPLKDANGNVIMHVFHSSASAGANIKG